MIDIAPLPRRGWTRALLIALSAILTGCQTMGGAGTDVSCDAFGPLGWSRSDTVQTARDVREHNAAWTALCHN